MNLAVQPRPRSIQQYRLALVVGIVILIPLGLATKAYGGPGAAWVRDYSGDILFEMLWMAVISFGWPRLSPNRIAGGVFGVTAAIELLQLWQPPWLMAIRTTLPGKLLLGTVFSGWDFLYYAIGCLIGWLGLRYLRDRL